MLLYMFDYIWSKGIHRNNYSALQSNQRVINETTIQEIIKIYDGNIIWIRNGPPTSEQTDLDVFSKHIDKIQQKSVLVTGDGVRPVPSSYSETTVQTILNCDNIVSWYTQNYDGTLLHEKIKYMPIGFDLHTPKALIDNEPIKKILYMINCRLSNEEKIVNYILSDTYNSFTNPIRKIMYDTLKDNPSIKFVKNRLPFDQVTKLYNEYLFVLSPEGNGLDCHRTWELFLAGCIVIVKKTSLDDMYIKNKLPVVILDKWSELNENLEEKLKQWRETYLPYTNIHHIYSRLKYNYWIKELP